MDIVIKNILDLISNPVFSAILAIIVTQLFNFILAKCKQKHELKIFLLSKTIDNIFDIYKELADELFAFRNVFVETSRLPEDKRSEYFSEKLYDLIFFITRYELFFDGLIQREIKTTLDTLEALTKLNKFEEANINEISSLYHKLIDIIFKEIHLLSGIEETHKFLQKKAGKKFKKLKKLKL